MWHSQCGMKCEFSKARGGLLGMRRGKDTAGGREGTPARSNRRCRSGGVCVCGLKGVGNGRKYEPLRAQGLRVPPTLPRESWDFEPEGHDHGDDSEGSSSFEQSLFNAVNILMGVGLLSIPYALKEGGWASLGVLAAVWASTNYTGKILIKCQEYYSRQQQKQLSELAGEMGVQEEELEKITSLPQRSVLGKVMTSYEEIGEAAFGDAGRQFITTILYAELIGTCALFFILEGDHMQLLLHQLMPHHHIPSKEELMLLSAGVFVPTTWLPDLSSLSYVGALGMLSAFGLTGVVMYQWFHGGIQIADTIPIDTHSLPAAFGLVAFVFAGHAVFPSIYRSMKDKTQYGQMLDWTYAIVGATCVAMAVAGYCLYGGKTMEEVTLNLPPGLLSLISTSLILVSPFTKFALTLEPVARGVESKLGIDINGPTQGFARLNRTGLGLGALLLATKVPFFGNVMSIVGSFLTIMVSVIFPAMCHLKLYDGDMKQTEKWFNYFVITLGIGCAASGTWTAVTDILDHLGKN